jgi:hypothetical protein
MPLYELSSLLGSLQCPYLLMDDGIILLILCMEWLQYERLLMRLLSRELDYEWRLQ